MVERSLQDLGVPYTPRPLLAETGGFGTSLYVDFPGKGGTNDLIVLATPYYAPTANDDHRGGLTAGTQAAIALAARLAKWQGPQSIRIAFLADEKSNLPADLRSRTSRGLEALIAGLDAPERTFFVYLDIQRSGVPLELRHGSKRRLAPLALVTALLNAAGEAGISLPIALPFNELYRLGWVDGPEPLRVLHRANIPAVLLEEEKAPPAPAPDLTPEALAGFLEKALGTLSPADGNEEDERYAFLSLGSLTVPLSELTSVVLLLSAAAMVLASILIYSLTHRHLMIARLKVFLFRSWAIALYFLILAGSVRAAGFVLDLALSVTGDPPDIHPYGAAAVKLLLAFSLYNALALLLDRWIAPRRPHFYGTAATVILTFLVLGAAVADITFVPVFIWSLVLALLSTTIKNPALSMVPTLLAPLQILLAAMAAVGSGDASMALAFTGGSFGVEAYLAIAALPYLFLFKRVALLRHARMARTWRKRPRRSVGRPLAHHHWTRPLFVTGSVAAVIVFAANTAVDAGAAPRPLRERVPATENTLSVKTREEAFLDRRTVSISIYSAQAPDRVDVSILSDSGEIVLYDAGVPFSYTEDGRAAHLALGEGPPPRIDLEVTLPRTTAATIRVEALRRSGVAAPPGVDYARIETAEARIGEQP